MLCSQSFIATETLENSPYSSALTVEFCLFPKDNITLKSLNVAWNGFGNDGALAMGEALKVNSTLLELDLT